MEGRAEAAVVPSGRFVAGGAAHVLYNLALVPAVLLAAPAWVPWILSSGRRRRNFPQRLGWGLASVPPPAGRGRLWIHAVSVGETLAAAPLVRLLRQRHPGLEILVSTVTLTGQSVASKSLGGETDGRFYFPFDLPWTCAAFLDRIRPDAVAILETEIWPNFIAACARRGIPVAVLNGRLSERSFEGYRRLGFLFGRVLRSVSAFSVQTEEDARRLVALGAVPSAVAVTGNMKFDIVPPPDVASPLTERLLAAKSRGTVWFVAGSTHEGEDREVLRALEAARAANPKVRLLLAPRHPERFEAVALLCGAHGFPVTRRTRLDDGGDDPGSVVLLDTVGELQSAYAAADIAFVGGSLVPKGGHNVLEPALFGVPTAVGPHMENFREIAGLFLARRALLQVDGADAFVALVAAWAADPRPFAETGRRARALLDSFRGAAERNADLVARELSRGGKAPGTAAGAAGGGKGAA